MVIVSPLTSMIVVGLVILATCLVAKPTPEGKGKVVSVSWRREGAYKELEEQLGLDVGKREEEDEDFPRLCMVFLKMIQSYVVKRHC